MTAKFIKVIKGHVITLSYFDERATELNMKHGFGLKVDKKRYVIDGQITACSTLREVREYINNIK